jgi:hypothetical protein
MFNRTAIAIACGTLITPVLSVAQAMPFAPGGLTPPAGIILVEGGCGRGWHPGPVGACVRNWGPSWPCYWVRTPAGPRLICH